MTESQLRSKVANWPVQYLGISEGSEKHKAIIKVLNDSKLCTRYKMTTKDHWCATTVSAAFIACKLAGKAGSGSLFECVECSCGQMIKLAQKQGIWVEKDNYVPKVGDVVMYDWDDTGKGDNTGWPEHVGIVCSVSEKTFKVIEGNMNDTVGYRTMVVNGKYIRGFITPKYSKFATKKAATVKLNKTCKFKGTVTSPVKMRAKASKSGTAIKTLKKNSVVQVCDTVTDKAGNVWYYIKESNKFGYVNSDYVSKGVKTKTKESDLNKTCKFKAITTVGVNVRDWAGTEYKILRKIAKGKAVQVCDSVKASSGKTWYYIKQAGKYGFVNSEYIAKR